MEMNKDFDSVKASSVRSSKDNDIHVLMGTNYDAILGHLCSKIEGASYYSGSSSGWFLRGALGKYEEERNANLISSGNDSFSPRGLTDVLLAKRLLEEDSEEPLEKAQEKKEELEIEKDRG